MAFVVLLCGEAEQNRKQPNIGRDYSFHECYAGRPQYKMHSISDLNYRYIGLVIFPRSLIMLAGTTNQIQKTTVRRFVHILATVDTSYWGPQQV